MGAQNSQLKPEQLDDLATNTHFDPKELKSMLKQFKKEVPSGAIGKGEFKDVMKQMGITDEVLQDLIFRVFDTNKDGAINFQEFVHALSIMTRGTPDQKLEFAFGTYADETGYISKEGMNLIMESFYKLVGPLVTFSGKNFESSQQIVDDFFEQMDTNGDGKVTLEEYREGARKNLDIIRGLKLFDKP